MKAIVSGWNRQDVRLDLVGVGEAVHQVEQADDGQHLAQTLIIQTQPLHGGGVRIDSVTAIVGRRYGQGDDLLGQQIYFARPHDGLETRPAETQMLGMGSQSPPDIGHTVDFLCLLDVPEHFLHDRMRIILIDEFHCRHGKSSLGISASV